MAEASAPLASAVIVPDPVEDAIPSPTSLKRRPSLISEDNVKRPRLSHQESTNGNNNDARSPTLEANNSSKSSADRRRNNNHLEERKRGQRLFGALLGTLSQSSSSTASSKRRKDAEQKQSAKLRQEADEFDEKKKQRLEVVTNVRRREQRVYDRQAMRVRHSHLLAQANFLQTKTEPRLYYKPWELQESEKETIKSQVAEAETTIARESQEVQAKEEPSRDPKADPPGTDDTIMQEAPPHEPPSGGDEKVGSDANPPESNDKEDDESVEEEKPKDQTAETVEESSGEVSKGGSKTTKESQGEDAKDHGDDGGDLVEGDEDAVIY